MDNYVIEIKFIILEIVPISYTTLVFHSIVWCFHQLISIIVERIGSKVMFIALQHGLNLFKLLPGNFKIIIQYVIIKVQFSILTRIMIFQMGEMADIYSYIIVINRVANLPYPLGISRVKVYYLN